MFFFRVELTLFDEERQTLYLYPDTQALGKDETPVFQESALKSNPIFKKYVKRLKTNVVDVEYRLFSTDSALPDELDDDCFSELREKGKLEEIDGNEFCIIVDRAKSGGKKNGGNKSMFAIVAVIAAVMLLFAAMSLKNQPQDSTSIGEEVSSDVPENSEESSDLIDSSEEDLQSSAESEESEDISDNSEIMESDDGESFDFPPPEDIQHL